MNLVVRLRSKISLKIGIHDSVKVRRTDKKILALRRHFCLHCNSSMCPGSACPGVDYRLKIGLPGGKCRQ